MKNKAWNGNTNKKALFSRAAEAVSRNWRVIVLFAAGFAAVTVLNFLNVATGQTVASFSPNDFEIGQIADRTITAPRSLPADEQNPVSIEAGERIIRRGFPITEEAFAKLRKMAASPAYLDSRAFLNNELYLLVLACVWALLFLYLPFGRKVQLREVLLQVVFFFLVYACVAFARKSDVLSFSFALCAIVPASFCALLVAILYGELSAVLFSVIAAFGVFNAANWEAVPFLHTVVSCIAAANVVNRIERRIDMVVASLLLAFIDVACAIILAVIFNESFAAMTAVFFGVAFNGFVSGILALGFLTPLEFLLNTASVFRLMDLSDVNNPTMRRLMLTAAGTYSHSMMVAQLAESACREIGANALLARVGAYYHDIGKMEHSEYFVENQAGGENKLIDLNPSLSVAIIKNHVRLGVEKARQMHLPKPVIDIISEHHGNNVIAYFYNKAKEKDPNVNIEDFRYTGTPPTTRESAVVMLADTTEAACRTLENPTATRLEKFIQTLFNGDMERGQLDNCALTFRDLAKIKEAFVHMLSGYYHNRIEYPDQKDPDEKSDGQKSNEEKSGGNKKGGAKKSNEEQPENSDDKKDGKKSDEKANG